ncbi:unnamed protein product [Sphagnum jensenii]|uniref:Small RNA 2'-O-methyltransferase n=1 Tax=Sphagnum jensenii TaxID=128206 RepID=A0ABP0XG72_9BRYO
MFACTLRLPDGTSVESGRFRRKREAEQDAALRGLHKLGIAYEPGPRVFTKQQKYEELLKKISSAFTDQTVLSYMPLVEHFRAAVRQKGPKYGQIPSTVLTVLDTKIRSLCKSIDCAADKDLHCATSMVCKAAAACPLLCVSDDGLWIGRTTPFSDELVAQLLLGKESIDLDNNIETVHIPACMEKDVVSILLDVAGDDYYQEVLAHELGVPDAGHILPSRSSTPVSSLLLFLKSITIGWSFQVVYLHPKSFSNERASFLMGYSVYGDAILANVGSTWHSKGKCVYGDVTLNNYHRMMLGRTPGGAYKLSRQAVAVVDLPSTYSCRLQWRGANPRALLVKFCQQHWLPRPQFACSFPPPKWPSRSALNSADHERSNAVIESATLQEDNSIDYADEDSESDSKALQASQPQGNVQGPFQYTVMLQWCEGDKEAPGDKIEFMSEGFFRTRYDAIQSAALKALHHYNTLYKSGQHLATTVHVANHDQSHFSELSSSTAGGKCKCNKVEMAGEDAGLFNAPADFFTANVTQQTGPASEKRELFHVIAEQDTVGEKPPCRSMVTVSYQVTAVADVATPFAYTNTELEKTNLENIVLEVQHEFEFELGAGAVIAPFEECVSHAHVGQTLCFQVPALQPVGLLLASNENFKYPTHNDKFVLEYIVKLIKFVQAFEERMQASQFRPCLSKQRIEYARLVVDAIDAKSLVDLGCGSGALLNSLLEEPNSLQQIVGVDLSRKHLIRAAKMLHCTLTTQKPGHSCPWAALERLSLYEGSVTDMDPRLHAPDVATCIEVVEHLDPEGVEKLAESVLGCLMPRIWMIMTPNIEYNPILNGLQWDPATSSLLLKGASSSGASEGQVAPQQHKENAANLHKVPPDPSKFRNHDHRFEWTRAEFRHWASQIAARFDYQVRFGGVGGGDGGNEAGVNDDNTDHGPGFATQIAIFAHKAVLFPILTKEGELPALLACNLSGVTPEFSLPIEEVCTPSSKGNHLNYEAGSVVVADQFPYKEIWRWIPPPPPPPPHPNEATVFCSKLENLKIHQADKENYTQLP